jgi:hypothetical protein
MCLAVPGTLRQAVEVPGRRSRRREALLRLVADSYVDHESGWDPAADAMSETGLSRMKFNRLLWDARRLGLLERARQARQSGDLRET